MESVSFNEIDDQLFELQKACSRYKETDCHADWVLYAVSYHIMTNRATKQFECDFVHYPSGMLEELIKKCLEGDKSSDGIIRTCKQIISCKDRKDRRKTHGK